MLVTSDWAQLPSGRADRKGKVKMKRLGTQTPWSASQTKYGHASPIRSGLAIPPCLTASPLPAFLPMGPVENSADHVNRSGQDVSKPPLLSLGRGPSACNRSLRRSEVTRDACRFWISGEGK